MKFLDCQIIFIFLYLNFCQASIRVQQKSLAGHPSSRYNYSVNNSIPSSNLSNNNVRSDGARFIFVTPLAAESCSVNGVYGTAYTMRACTNRGGVSLGAYTSSTGAIGVCCSFTLTCTTNSATNTVTQNATYLLCNGDQANCIYNVPNRSSASSQIKVDLITFPYQAATSTTSACDVDSLTISGSTTVTSGFTVCGSSAEGTTLYLSYGTSQNITLAFSTATNKAHLVLVSFIPCAEAVPEGCLQYLQESSGVVRSFSYGSSMIASQHYSVCINNTINANTIRWSECAEGDPGYMAVTNQFFLSSIFANVDPTIAANSLPVTGLVCDSTSFVSVHGGEKHCGARWSPNFLTNVVESTGKPFMLNINIIADETEGFVWDLIFPYFGTVTATVCVSELGSATVGFNTCSDDGQTSYCTCIRGTDVTEVISIRTGFCLSYNLIA